MTALEKIRAWIATYPDFDILAEFQCDYTDHAMPNNGGIFPSGLIEVERRRSICGITTVKNQENFGLYYVFEKAAGDDMGAMVNAGWVEGFQQWVQEQSVLGSARTFGERPTQETITAQNAVTYETGEKTETYMVQKAVTY